MIEESIAITQRPVQVRRISDVLQSFIRDPLDILVRRWNWKAALMASLIRSIIFFLFNLRAGWHAAGNAMLLEFGFRALTAGLWGALTQAFYEVEPVWAGTLWAVLLIPTVSHLLEWGVHIAGGTQRIKASMISSIIFTVVSTLFNMYAMRRGALLVGPDANSLGNDLRRTPLLIAGFVAAGPIALVRALGRFGR